MEFILSLVGKSIEQVGLAMLHNWPYLIASVVIATLLKLYVDAEKVSAFLKRNRRAGVVAATTAAVATPLCSCGTTAVVLGMMASTMPWAPIVAFMVASPLTSPEGLVYTAGLFGWPFALAFFLSSIVLGLAGGWLAAVFETRGWLANQARFAERVSAASACACRASTQVSTTRGRVFSLNVPTIGPGIPAKTYGCAGAAASEPAVRCGCDQTETTYIRERPGPGCARGSSDPARSKSQVAPQRRRVTAGVFLRELYVSGKHLLLMFLGFAFIGYFLNGLIPADWVGRVFGGGNIYNVPLAATLGLPFYVNSEASLPLIRTLLDAGMSQGAALSFLISGSGTSIGAIAGALTIARWRVIALVVGVLWVGAMLTGLAFNLVLMLNVL